MFLNFKMPLTDIYCCRSPAVRLWRLLTWFGLSPEDLKAFNHKRKAATSPQTCTWAWDYWSGARIPVKWSKLWELLTSYNSMRERRRKGGWTCLSKFCWVSATWADHGHALTHTDCWLLLECKSINNSEKREKLRGGGDSGGERVVFRKNTLLTTESKSFAFTPQGGIFFSLCLSLFPSLTVSVCSLSM